MVFFPSSLLQMAERAACTIAIMPGFGRQSEQSRSPWNGTLCLVSLIALRRQNNKRGFGRPAYVLEMGPWKGLARVEWIVKMNEKGE